MKYYIAKTVSGDFSAVVERAIGSLKAEGFGVLHARRRAARRL